LRQRLQSGSLDRKTADGGGARSSSKSKGLDDFHFSHTTMLPSKNA